MDMVDEPLRQLGISPGDEFTFTYSFDSNAPDQDPAPEYGEYQVDYVSFSAGTVAVPVTAPGAVGVRVGDVHSYVVDALVAPFLPEPTTAYLWIGLSSFTPVFPGVSLPLHPVPLESFDKFLLLHLEGPGYGALGMVDAWTPEPATLSLLALGGLALLRRRR